MVILILSRNDALCSWSSILSISQDRRRNGAASYPDHLRRAERLVWLFACGVLSYQIKTRRKSISRVYLPLSFRTPGYSFTILTLTTF